MKTTKNLWSTDQLDTMERLVQQAASERRTPKWRDIAAVVGHSAVACCTRMSELRKHRRNAEEKARLQAMGIDTKPPVARKKPAKRLPPPVTVIPAKRVLDYTPHTIATSTHMLVADCELRARIGLQGITAGLLGDPIPGRSALDQKRQQACGSGGRGFGLGR